LDSYIHGIFALNNLNIKLSVSTSAVLSDIYIRFSKTGELVFLKIYPIDYQILCANKSKLNLIKLTKLYSVVAADHLELNLGLDNYYTTLSLLVDNKINNFNLKNVDLTKYNFDFYRLLKLQIRWLLIYYNNVGGSYLY
jgi:hypothetical protein